MIAQIKQPAESKRLQLDFPGAATALQAVLVERRGGGAGTLQVVGEIVIGTVVVTASGGLDGERYLVTARARLADGEIAEREIDLAIVDGTWAMPDGGTPYLSIADFVGRFGFDEAVRMTDGEGAGRIDRALLIGALADAQAIADSYLAVRYQVPLATVPPIIEMIVADLARARLYPRGAPEGIADAAKLAEQRLKSIQSGAMNLGLPIAQAPSAAEEAPIRFVAGKRAYPNGLEEY